MTDRGYIHTFSKKEQDRLLNQALFLEPYLYPGIEFPLAVAYSKSAAGPARRSLCSRGDFPVCASTA